MGLISLLQLIRVFFHVISWPSVTLVCPLYTSIRAIESDKESCYQHCLKYWVLFAIITLLEWTFAEFIVWVTYWPYAKGFVYLLLAVPHYGSASFLYSRFVKPYIAPDSCVQWIFLIPEIIDFASRKQNECTDTALAHIKQYEEEKWESLFTCEVESYHSLEQKASDLKKVQYKEECKKFVTCKVESDCASDQLIEQLKVQKELNCAIHLVSATSKKCLEKNMEGRKYNQEEEIRKKEFIANNEVAQEYREEVTMRSVVCEAGFEQTYYQRANLENVQKEWSCALCLVSTSSEKNLRQHMQGKKHRFKEQEFKENEKDAMNSEHRATGLLESLKLLQLRGFFSQIKRPIKLCSWRKPAYGWIKLNTDGSVVDKGHAGFGGLLRDHNGAPICAYVCKAQRGDTFMVELWAIWRGLRLALTMGIKFIWVESDSMSAVKTINREQASYVPKAMSCLECIWETLERFDRYEVSHSWRESNRAADYLSKMEIVGSDVVVLPVGFPRCLKKMIEDDAQGKWYCRL